MFPQQVNFIVAACENMISGGGMRPGDILTASNGKTIEVCVVGGSRITQKIGVVFFFLIFCSAFCLTRWFAA